MLFERFRTRLPIRKCSYRIGLLRRPRGHGAVCLVHKKRVQHQRFWWWRLCAHHCWLRSRLRGCQKPTRKDKLPVKINYPMDMSYSRDLRRRVIGYIEEGHTLAQAAAVFKVHVCSIIDWRKRYKATGDVKPKLLRPVNKKIVPEKLIAYVEAHPDAYLKEIVKEFGCHSSSVLTVLRKLGITRKKEHFLQRAVPRESRSVFGKNQRRSQRPARIYRWNRHPDADVSPICAQ